MKNLKTYDPTYAPLTMGVPVIDPPPGAKPPVKDDEG